MPVSGGPVVGGGRAGGPGWSCCLCLFAAPTGCLQDPDFLRLRRLLGADSGPDLLPSDSASGGGSYV